LPHTRIALFTKVVGIAAVFLMVLTTSAVWAYPVGLRCEWDVYGTEVEFFVVAKPIEQQAEWTNQRQTIKEVTWSAGAITLRGTKERVVWARIVLLRTFLSSSG
jgi:hypothetical protein